MATQYTATAIQDVAVNQNVLFGNDRPCNKGCILHQTGSGIFTLRGATKQSRARYRVTFTGNVAGATPPIMLAITLNGETLFNAVGMAYPAADDNYFNVSMDTLIDVPCNCCFTIAVKNISTAEISVSNSNLIIERVC